MNMLKTNTQSNKHLDDFDEESYLNANPDVELAVSKGHF